MAIALIALGFFLGLFGPRLLARAFRHELVSAIKRSLVGAEMIDVSLAPIQPRDLVQGIFREVRINGSGFTTQEGLHYDRLDFYSRSIQIDPARLFWRHELYWRRLGPTRLQVRVGEASLTNWLRLKLPEMKPRVKLRPGILRVEGRLDLRWTELDFGAEGDLRRKTSGSLIYYPKRLEVAGFKLPEQLFKKKLLSSLGGLEIPLEMPFPLDLSSFRVGQGYLKAEWREQPQNNLKSTSQTVR